MSSRLGPQSAATWQASEVLAVVALVAGPFVLPVVAAICGVLLLRASSCWSGRVKRVATVLGLLPAALAVLLVLALVAAPVYEPSHLLLGLVVLVVASHAAPMIAGVLLFSRRLAPRQSLGQLTAM